MLCVPAAGLDHLVAQSHYDEDEADDRKDADPGNAQADQAGIGQRVMAPHRHLNLSPPRECPDGDRRGERDTYNTKRPMAMNIDGARQQLAHRDAAGQERQRRAYPGQERSFIREGESIVGFVIDHWGVSYKSG
jgi:hypothetical protein